MNLKRLRQMDKDEIAYRVREKLRREADRVKFYVGWGVEEDPQFKALLEARGSSFKNYLIEGPAQRFYSSTQHRDEIRMLIGHRFTPWFERAVEEADRLSEHRVDFLGYTNVGLGRDINWHCDPISGYTWPRGYWADFDLVRAKQSDPKIIHELNRQQHLPRLAKAFFLTGDERYAREAVAQMESWIDQNAKWNGVNWQSSLELAIRSISWLWTIFLLLPSKSLDERATRRICKSLFGQIDHIYRYPSIYSSPNTHLIGEAAALFIAGLLFPELPRAASWREFGANTLIREMDRQVSLDGVYGELSSYYHCYAADFYLHTLVLGRLNRFAFPDWMWNRLAQMFEFVLHLTRPDGTIPLLGDDDGGRVLALAARDYRSYRDGLSSGAILFGRRDFKHQAETFREESLWLLGDDAWHIFDSLAAQHPAQTHRFYADAGYFCLRSGWEEQDSHVVFDCGGFGAMTGGHSHADTLSLALFADGQELLVDPGTSVYNCAPEWRDFFRSTRAHNTVVVDGADQSETHDTFRWKTKANARLNKQLVLSGIEYIDGEHDGYDHIPHNITHRRRLVFIRPNYWIVLDELRGRGDHKFDFLYHFAPEAELIVFDDERRGEVDCRASIKESGLQMFLYGSSAVQAEALCGHTEPLQGWSSHQYGERRPSPVLKATLHGFAPSAMMTFLMPGREAKRSRRLYPSGGQAIAAVVRDEDHEDISVLSIDSGELRLMDFAMHGEFFWIRTQNGALKQLLAVNARSFSSAGENVFQNDEPVPYVLAHFWENGMVIEHGEEGKVYVRDLRDRQFQRN